MDLGSQGLSDTRDRRPANDVTVDIGVARTRPSSTLRQHSAAGWLGSCSGTNRSISQDGGSLRASWRSAPRRCCRDRAMPSPASCCAGIGLPGDRTPQRHEVALRGCHGAAVAAVLLLGSSCRFASSPAPRPSGSVARQSIRMRGSRGYRANSHWWRTGHGKSLFHDVLSDGVRFDAAAGGGVTLVLAGVARSATRPGARLVWVAETAARRR